jgi:hypothetical protein
MTVSATILRNGMFIVSVLSTLRCSHSLLYSLLHHAFPGFSSFEIPM